MYLNLSKISNKTTIGYIDSEDTKAEIIAILNKSTIDTFLSTILQNKSNKLQIYLNEFRTLFMKYTLNYTNLKDLADIITKKPFKFHNSFTINDIYNYYNNLVPNTITKQLYIDLCNYKGVNENQPVIGKGELLLAFFTVLDKSNIGDLTDHTNKYKNIEVKSNNARLKGGNNYVLKYATSVKKQLKTLTKLQLESTDTINIKDLKLLYTYIQDNIDDETKITKIIQHLINFKGIKPNIHCYKLLKSIKSFEDFRSFALTLHLFAYTTIEKISLYMFVDMKKEQFIVFKPTKNFKYCYTFVKSHLINLVNWSNSKPAFEIDFK